MNREIKFRAWDKINKRMSKVLGWNFKFGDLTVEADEEDWIEEPEFELMQYTGLKDKNGIEIYEGDICRIDTKGAFPPYGNPDSEELTDIAILAVEWWNGQFVFNAARYEYLDNNGDDYINFGWWVRSNDNKPQLKQIKIIGNIYENAELLAPILPVEGNE